MTNPLPSSIRGLASVTMSHSNQQLAQPGEDPQSASLAETKTYKDWVAPTLNSLSFKSNEVEKLRAESEVLKRQSRSLQDIALKGKQKDRERPEHGAVSASSSSFILQQQHDLEVQVMIAGMRDMREEIKQLRQQLLSVLGEKNPANHLREETKMPSDRLTKYQNHLPSRVEKSADSADKDSKDDLIWANDRITTPESAQKKSKHAVDQTLSSHAGSVNDLKSASRQLELEATESRKPRKQVQTTNTSKNDAVSDLLVSDNLRQSAI